MAALTAKSKRMLRVVLGNGVSDEIITAFADLAAFTTMSQKSAAVLRNTIGRNAANPFITFINAGSGAMNTRTMAALRTAFGNKVADDINTKLIAG